MSRVVPVRIAIGLMIFAAIVGAPREGRAGAFMLDPGAGQFIAGVGYTRH